MGVDLIRPKLQGEESLVAIIDQGLSALRSRLGVLRCAFCEPYPENIIHAYHKLQSVVDKEKWELKWEPINSPSFNGEGWVRIAGLFAVLAYFSLPKGGTIALKQSEIRAEELHLVASGKPVSIHPEALSYINHSQENPSPYNVFVAYAKQLASEYGFNWKLSNTSDRLDIYFGKE